MMNRSLIAAALSLACTDPFAQTTSTSTNTNTSTPHRDVNQQTRIENGLKNGSLTNHEVSKPERGQAHVDRKEASAGHVDKAEQRGIRRAESRQGKRIHHEKHDAQLSRRAAAPPSGRANLG